MGAVSTRAAHRLEHPRGEVAGRTGCRPAATRRHRRPGRRCSTPSRRRVAGRRRQPSPTSCRPGSYSVMPGIYHPARTYDAAHAPAERDRRGLPQHGDADDVRPRLVDDHLRPEHRSGWRRPRGDASRSSSSAWTSWRRSAGAWSRCRWASTSPTGSRTPTSTSTSTCATTPWRRRGRRSSWPRPCPASSAGRSTAAGRCGSCT